MQRVIEEADLDELLAEDELPEPASWREPITGRPLPSVVAVLRGQRGES